MNSYKSADIFYFSGTGNSRNVALWFAAEAGKRGLEAGVSSVKDSVPEPASCRDRSRLKVFTSPVHGFNYPAVMLRFLLRFPKGRGDVMLFNTRAGMAFGKFRTPGISGITFILASVILRLKGYRICGTCPVDMPSNWLFVHPALKDKPVRLLHLKSRQRVQKAANRILNGKTFYRSLPELPVDILASPVAPLYLLFARFVLSKTLYATEDCNGCRLCASGCASDAIKFIDGRPYWTVKCESCMQCLSVCPKKAVNTNHGPFILLIILFLHAIVPSVKLLFPETVSLLETDYPFLLFIVWNLMLLAALIIWYRLMHRLKKIRIIGRLVDAASLTRYSFWGHSYSAKAVKEDKHPESDIRK